MGILIWRSITTRPDVSNTVSAVARNYHNPTEKYGKAVHKIMAHLHGTRGIRLISVGGSGLDLTAYNSADYAKKSHDRRLLSGTVNSWGVRPSGG